jgi:hypothetical protein
MAIYNAGQIPYATPEEFACSNNLPIDDGNVVPDGEELSNRSKFCYYLSVASRYIKFTAKRDFLPFRETRSYPIPHQFMDLSMRRLTASEVKLDEDLLEIYSVTDNNNKVLPPEAYFTIELNITPKNYLMLRPPNLWNYGLVFQNVYDAAIKIDGVWGFHDEYSAGAWEFTGQTNDTVISASQTLIALPSVVDTDICGAPLLSVDTVIKIGNEFMLITKRDIVNRQITVLRGIRGTTAVEHQIGKSIYRWRVVEDIRLACIQTAKIWREFDASTGGRLGVTDYQASVELGVPGDAQKIIASYRRARI